MNTFMRAALSGAAMIGLMAVSDPGLAKPPAEAANAKANTASKTAPSAASSAVIPKSVKDKMSRAGAATPTASALTTQECKGLGGEVIWAPGCDTSFQCIRQDQHSVLYQACITELRPD